MTIAKGAEWGTLAAPTPGMPTVHTDAELAQMAGRPTGPIGLLGGDVMRTAGGAGDASRFGGPDPIPHLPIDLVTVRADDGREATFVAHLIARRGWWRGPITAVMNAEFVGRWDVAPRSHPNDGKVDVVEVAASFTAGQRRLARRRLLTGTHVPHPDITIRQHRGVHLDLGRPRRVWLDGQRWGRARTLDIEVVPDALTICV